MYELETDQNTFCATLHLKDSLTVAYASEIRDALVKAISSTNNLVIEHTNVKEYDLSYLQLLISFHKTATVTGKTFSLKGIDASLFKSLVEDSGCPEYSWLTKDIAKFISGDGK